MGGESLPNDDEAVYGDKAKSKGENRYAIFPLLAAPP
jgi:hypothetical protein